jgi:hypothetical protein
MIGFTSDKSEANLHPTWRNELQIAALERGIKLSAKDLHTAIQTVKDTLRAHRSFVDFRQPVTIHVVAPIFTKVLEQVSAFWDLPAHTHATHTPHTGLV